jgi:hypothetical protein
VCKHAGDAARSGRTRSAAAACNRDELQVTEREAPLSRAGEVVEAAPEGVRLAVELERRVIGHDGIVRELRGHEVWIDRMAA